MAKDLYYMEGVTTTADRYPMPEITAGTVPLSKKATTQGVAQSAQPASFSTGWNDAGLPLGGLIGGALAGAGLLGAAGQGSYQPQERALARFYELTDPNSDYHKKLRAMYGRYLADAAPNQNTLLGLARSGGSDVTSASALALRQGQAQANQNKEQILNMQNRDMMQSEQLAAGYLNTYEQSRQYADKANDSSSFFDNVLGIGGSLLSKFLV